MHRQDLHIHTTWSYGDSAVVAEQTVGLIAGIRHADIIGISDHFEFLAGGEFEGYAAEVRRAGFCLGTEVNGHSWVEAAAQLPFDYFIFHCYDYDEDYRATERLLATGRPVIIAHPNALNTNLDRVPPQCLIEINNRYVWRCDWRAFYGPHVGRFGFVLSSDAHQPNWLNQNVARYVAQELGIRERIVFS